MRKHVIASALLLVSTSTIADLADDVRCREIAFSQAAETRDSRAFRSFIDGDARFVGSAVTRGPDEILTAWQPFFSADGPAIKWRPQFVEVRNDGELALTRGPYRMTTQDRDGNPIVRWGTFNSIWRKDKHGDWYVIFDAGNQSAELPDDETRALLDRQDDCE